MPVTAKRSARDGLLRGLKRKCPNCGQGELFRGYLAVKPTCSNCGHHNGRYRADDGPAYVTILLVGHVVVAPLLTWPVIWEASPWMVAPAALSLVGAATLAALPFVKGGFIGALWAAGGQAEQ